MLFFFAGWVCAQTPQQWEKRADQSLKKNDYYGAAFYLKKAVYQDSSDLARFEKLARSLRMYNNYNESAAAYKELFYRDENEQFPLALFYWALMEKQTGNYEIAQKRFEQFLKIYHKKDFYHEKAQIESKACIWAQNHLKNADSVSVESVGPEVNTFDSEMAPSWYSDSVFFFTSLRFDSANTKVDEYQKPDWVTLKATKREENWTTTDSLKIHQMDPQEIRLNVAFDSTRNTMYYTRCLENCMILRSEWNGQMWEPGEDIGRAVNFPGWNATHPTIAYSNGKEYLIYVTDRDRGGEGRYDIWQVELRKNGRIGRAKSLRKINTPGNEITPRYDAKNQTLYFSSDYHAGFGGYDVFKSKGEITQLNQVENALLPINSPANDLYFQPYQDSLALLVSNREGSISVKDETCCNDIYTAKIKTDFPTNPPTPPILAEEKDTLELTLAPKEVVSNLLPVTVYFDNDQPNPKTKQTTTRANYQNLVNNYLDRKSEFVSKLENLEARQIQVFFDYNVEKGFHQLENLADSLLYILNEGAQVHIGIRGYASPLAQSDYNDYLSQRRVQSVLNYLWSIHDRKLEKHHQNGNLVVHRLPFGERLSATKVSDELENQKASVYSVAASMERKVRLGVIRSFPKNEAVSVLIFEKEWVDFETLPLGETKTHQFEFKNVGTDTLSIDQIIPSCGCTTIEYTQQKIAPGASGFITIEFTAKGLPGVQIRKIKVVPTGNQEEYTLFIRAEVTP